jgi:hypothetical protein
MKTFTLSQKMLHRPLILAVIGLAMGIGFLIIELVWLILNDFILPEQTALIFTAAALPLLMFGISLANFRLRKGLSRIQNHCGPKSEHPSPEKDSGSVL